MSTGPSIKSDNSGNTEDVSISNEWVEEEPFISIKPNDEVVTLKKEEPSPTAVTATYSPEVSSIEPEQFVEEDEVNEEEQPIAEEEEVVVAEPEIREVSTKYDSYIDRLYHEAESFGEKLKGLKDALSVPVDGISKNPVANHVLAQLKSHGKVTPETVVAAIEALDEDIHERINHWKAEHTKISLRNPSVTSEILSGCSQILEEEVPHEIQEPVLAECEELRKSMNQIKFVAETNPEKYQLFKSLKPTAEELEVVEVAGPTKFHPNRS